MNTETAPLDLSSDLILTFWSTRLKTVFDDWISSLLGEALADLIPEILEDLEGFETEEDDGFTVGDWKKKF